MRQYYWVLLDGNNRTIAWSGESYVNKSGCQRAIDNVRYEVPSAGVVDDS